VSAEAVRVVEEIQQALTARDVVSALNDPADRSVAALFMRHAEPDFTTTMVGPDYLKRRVEYAGLDGFVEAWRDWTEAFETYSVDVEEMIDAGDHVVSLVELTGRTRTGGAEISAPAAAVWTVVDDRVRGVEFHLDRNAALRAAGLEPG
jgi:ketosteroid isomerase-like protein